MWFDRLLAADAIVADVRQTREILVDALGLEHAREADVIHVEGVEWEMTRFLIHPDPTFGVTLFQLMARVTLTQEERALAPPMGDFITAYDRAQRADRPVRTHALSIITHRLDELPAHLDARGVPYSLTPGEGFVWVGVGGDPVFYDPRGDGGLFAEFVDRRPAVDLPTQHVVPDVAPGTLVRVTARSILVDDTEAVLGLLRSSFDWPQEPDVRVDERLDHRRTIIAPAVPTSAVIELLEPTAAEGRIAATHARWGAGPFATRIGVLGLEQALPGLWDRGTRWSWIEPVDGRPRVLLDPATVGGMVLELEELPTVAAG